MKKIGQNKTFGSFEHYNRVLYGGHANDVDQGKFFTFAGDTPLFMGTSSDYTKDTWCYQAKNGILMSGIALTPGVGVYSRWFHDCQDVLTEWHSGYMTYKMTQFGSHFSAVNAEIEVYPLFPDSGYFVHYKIKSEQRLLFCAGFGAITPFFGRFEYHESNGREFSVSDCDNNTVELGDGYAAVKGPGTTMLIGTDFDCFWTTDAAAAMEEAKPGDFLPAHEGESKIVKITHELLPETVFEGNILVLKDGTPEQLKAYLADKDLARKLRGAIREKYASVSFRTPDETLNNSFHNTMVGLDASFHLNSFFHGAIGYHAPFLGWRGWYAPTLLGWADRVKAAVKTHFDTILRSNGEEKVWWDGGDRPDLDHEGTQYHHLENTHGRLPALLFKDDIYDMQEVAVDMTLYYLEHSGDFETCEVIFDRLCEVLDWEERILDPDGDGMYQNFLNTWISDGHSYNGAACAQASSYNYAANLRTAKLGKALGKDVAKLEQRAAKIQQAFQGNFWLNEEGVVAESIDSIGNKLVHPAPELSTIYLAADCGNTDQIQTYRMLNWVERNIPVERTALRNGKIFYSADWKPKKYSTKGLFPAENACLALTYFQNGQPEKAMEIIDAFMDAFDLSPNQGSIRHVLSAQGAPDGGDIDFTDVTSCYLRMVIEGLWGIRFRLSEKKIFFAPQIPADWNSASISVPQAAITVSRTEECDSYTFVSECDAVKIIRLPLRTASVDQIFLNGKEITFDLIPGFGRAYVEFTADHIGKNDVKIYYTKQDYPALEQTLYRTFAGNIEHIRVTDGKLRSIMDFNGILQETSGCDCCRFVKVVADKPGIYDCIACVESGAGDVLLPFSVEVREVRKKEAPLEIKEQDPLDISASFNAALTEIHTQEFKSPRPESYSIGMRLNGRYAWEWNHYGHNALVVDDSLLRKCGGVITTKSGIPFRTPAAGNNSVTVSIWDNFPTKQEIPVNAQGKELAVLLCGTTHAMQSFVVNAKLTVVYEDSTTESVDLIPPVNFDDFLLGAYQTQNEILYFSDGTHGLVQKIKLDPAKKVAKLEVEAIANEVILNILGITIRK